MAIVEKYEVDKADLVSVADSIRAKGGTEDGLVFPQGFKAAVDAIKTKGDTVLQSKTVTPSKEQQIVRPDEGSDALSETIVEPIPDEYIVPEGTIEITEAGEHDVSGYASANVNIDVTEPEGTRSITNNGVYDVKEYAAVEVNVPTEIPEDYIRPSGITNITENGLHEVGQYEYAQVNVPVPEGYIKPEGTQTISENGTYDVTNDVNVTVNVPETIPEGYIQPSGTKEILANGIHDVAEYESVEVNIPTGGGGGGNAITTPLTITENGTYDMGYETVIEEWGVDSEYDVTIPVEEGVTLRVKKAEKLTIPHDMSVLKREDYRITVKLADGSSLYDADLEYIYFTPIYSDEAETIIAGYIQNNLGYSVMWIIDATLFNEMLGVTYFEDNTVYLSDYFIFADENWKSCKLIANGQPADGFMPVTVDVQPLLSNITITENGVYSPEGDLYGYRDITVDYKNDELIKTVSREVVDIPAHLGKIGSYAFYNCGSLKRIRRSRGDIGTNAFYNCSSLTDIITYYKGGSAWDVGENVIDGDYRISSSAFYSCEGLSGRKRIFAQYIDSNAFSYCTGIESVALTFESSSAPNVLGANAFSGCTGLKHVAIHYLGYHSSDVLYASAFSGCTNLESITFWNNPRNSWAIGAPQLEGSFTLPSTFKGIYVPENSVEAFKSAEGWSNYADKIMPYPTYTITFYGGGCCSEPGEGDNYVTGLKYYDTSINKLVNITEGMSVTVSGFINLHFYAPAYYDYCKIGTAPGASNVARIGYAPSGNAYHTRPLPVNANEMWFVEPTNWQWYKNDIPELT